MYAMAVILAPCAGEPARAVVLFEETFDTDVPDAATFNTQYPAFTTTGTLNVTGGVVQNEAASDITVPGFDEDIVIDLDVGAELSNGSYNVGLLVGGNRMVFHPGFTGIPGAFRVDGGGGFGNSDMGFVPANAVLHQMRVVQFHDTGLFQITVTDGSTPANVYTASFTNAASVGGAIGFTRASSGTLDGLFDNLTISTAAELTAIPADGSQLVASALLGTSTTLSDAIRLENTGIDGSGLDLLSFSISGPDAALFDVPDFTPLTLTAGGSAVELLDLSFTPTQFGAFNATLLLQTNAGDITLDLVGAAVPEPSTGLLLAIGLVGMTRRRKSRCVA